ncbi:MAG: PilW family protein [Gammaproteobacteria bacterium]|nr:PilW family protein [Gammaproteobacteria bacterium]MCP5202336.1 PilW family protein [Gammaproteobacteria bacterium]
MRARRHHRERGFSIIELMTAVTISLIMFSVIIELFASNKQAYRLQEGASRLNENARYAVSHLQYFMRLADHWGGIEAPNVNLETVPAVSGTDCSGAAVVSNVGFRGYNGAATRPSALDCIPAANYEPTTDLFFIRYGAEPTSGATDFTRPWPDSGIPPAPGTSTYPIYKAHFNDASSKGIWVATLLGRRASIFERSKFGDLPADMQIDDQTVNQGRGTYYRFQSMLYYVRPCSNPASGSNALLCDAGDDGIPALVRRTLNPDMTFTEQTVVSGVENMQLLYGVDNNADFIADQYETAATIDANADWDKVVTVRVRLIVANTERDTTVNDTKQYFSLDPNEAAWTPPAEARSFRRNQYDFTVQIRNMTRA